MKMLTTLIYIIKSGAGKEKVGRGKGRSYGNIVIN